MQVSLTKIWLAAFAPLTKSGGFEDYSLNLSTSDEGLVRWDEFRQLGLQKEIGLLAVLSAWLTAPASLVDVPRGPWRLFCRCASFSSSLPSSQWETSSEAPKLSVPWHPVRTEQARLSFSLGQGSINSHTVAGDSKGFFFSPALPHISTCVFLYILFVPDFFGVYSRTEL